MARPRSVDQWADTAAIERGPTAPAVNPPQPIVAGASSSAPTNIMEGTAREPVVRPDSCLMLTSIHLPLT